MNKTRVLTALSLRGVSGDERFAAYKNYSFCRTISTEQAARAATAAEINAEGVKLSEKSNG